MNEQNLRTPTSDEAREMQKKGVEKRKENKMISEIYKKIVAEKKVKIEQSIDSILDRKDSTTVQMIKELREAIEGQKIDLSGEVRTGENLNAEERLEQFEKLMKK